MKSKIDIYNAFAIILCAVSVIFAASGGSVLSRVICFLSAIAALAGVIFKIREGGSSHA